MLQIFTALPTAPSFSSPATCDLRLGIQQVETEHYQTAIATLTPCTKDRSQAPYALANLGIAYRQLGQYTQALRVYRTAAKELLARGDRSSVGNILGNIGSIYGQLGSYDLAKQLYQQSLDIAKQTNDRPGESLALTNLATIAANQENLEQAIQLYRQSLERSQTPDRQAATLINLGTAHHSLNQPQQALKYYQQALQAAQKNGDRRHESEALGSLGLVDEDNKQYDQAIGKFRQSLSIAQTLGDPAFEGMSLNNLGHALLSARKLQEAEQVLKRAIAKLDQLRPGLTDTYKVSIFDTQVNTYNLLQQVHVAAKQYDQGLEASEQSRARAFAELLANRKSKNTVANPTITLEKIKQLAKQKNATLVEYSIIPDDDFKFRGKQRGRESELYIWVVHPNGKIDFRRSDVKSLWKADLQLADLVALARCLQPVPVCYAVPNSQTPLPESVPPGLWDLHQFLITPIADLLPQNPEETVIFVPHESLFLVPFAALLTSDGKPLIESHTIAYAPSLQILSLTQSHHASSLNSLQNPVKNALIVGNPSPMPDDLDPLPNAQTEAAQVAQLFQTQPLLQTAAIKSTVVKRLASAKLIHLATHGVLEWQQTPLQDIETPGAIALAPDRTTTLKNTGWLTAKELLEIPLTADLVVLSACDTGQGKITGDGVLGLARSFLAAGAARVMVSLWAVNDAVTAKLMIQFYQQLRSGLSQEQALRQAMLTTLKHHPSPKLWAAFNLMG
ncbi:MAG: CHAT domain-containing tetratricopeptide repeat protein [Synechococcales bacterium]|nr:CHAT domain-containing tetratricopeptide repeat protein [Synechococcales bacterium]